MNYFSVPWVAEGSVSWHVSVNEACDFSKCKICFLSLCLSSCGYKISVHLGSTIFPTWTGYSMPYVVPHIFFLLYFLHVLLYLLPCQCSLQTICFEIGSPVRGSRAAVRNTHTHRRHKDDWPELVTQMPSKSPQSTDHEVESPRWPPALALLTSPCLSIIVNRREKLLRWIVQLSEVPSSCVLVDACD